MDDESATLLFGVLLVVVVVSWLLQIVSVLASFIALGWRCSQVSPGHRGHASWVSVRVRSVLLPVYRTH